MTFSSSLKYAQYIAFMRNLLLIVLDVLIIVNAPGVHLSDAKVMYYLFFFVKQLLLHMVVGQCPVL